MNHQTLQWIATAIVMGILVLFLFAPKPMWWILIIGGSLGVVAAAVQAQGIQNGLAGGLFVAGLFAVVTWFRYKKVSRNQEKGHTILVAWWDRLRYPVICERCNATLPKFQMPRSIAQLLWGGWTCPHCGAELDSKGRQKTSQS